MTEAWRVGIGLLVAVSGIILATRYLKVNAFFSLLFATAIYGVIAGISFADILTVAQTGFGTLLQQIGLVVAFGSVLGMLLEKTGAMEAISTGILKAFGTRRSLPAFGIIGMLVGVPVFCDSGFIILSRLIPALALKSGVPGSSYTLMLSSGLYTTHTLVPPTPGPLAAASNVGAAAHLGVVMLSGLLIAIPVVLVAYLYSRAMGPRLTMMSKTTTDEMAVSTMPLFKAILPILLPVVLIALASFSKMLPLPDSMVGVLNILGNPVVALLSGISCALVSVNKDHQLSVWIGDALKDAGIILLITGAGGAFGAVIKASGIDKLLSNLGTGNFSEAAILTVAWTLAAILKTAQGSTTSAIIIASSLIAPLAGGFTTPFELSLLVIVVGGGAMCMSHANDSYFWVVSQFGGLSATDAFRSFTVLTALMGVTVLAVTIILALLL